MLRKKTAFVLGAGASCEAGLPSGEVLKKKIATMLTDGLEAPSDSSLPGATVLAALEEYAREKGADPKEVRYAAYRIRNCMSLALSIDNYLDTQRDDPDIEACGKLAIAQAILDAERESKLYAGGEPGVLLDPSKLEGTWYPKLFQLLTEGVDVRSSHRIFENVAFVIFNYDRCLEHFLSDALSWYYRIQYDAQCVMLENASFIHPYGTIGRLNWQDGEPSASFGGAPHYLLLKHSAQRLRIFTEQFEDPALIERLAQALEEAETIIFLGFAFHEQNMEFLCGLKNCRRVFATAYGISSNDCDVIRRRILSIQPSVDVFELRNDLTCTGLLNQYWHTLRME